MYEAFFQLSARPFAAAPQVDRYFPARAVENARQTLARVIERAEGAGLVIGPTGTGKSLLLQVLAEQFRDRFDVALLANGHLTTRRALVQAISFELGLPYRGLEEGELRLSLIDHLAPGTRCPQGMLLLLDEAHRLPLRLMEEVRMITNLVRNGQPRVRLVLTGSAALEERFARPELESFSQRLSARCYLETLDRAETISYVRSQIAGLGGNPDSIFTADALESVFEASGGIPRLINQLCDHSLLLAFAGGSRQLNKAGIAEAWADLQQLPSPWNETTGKELAVPGLSAPSRNESVVEFGQLAEELSPDVVHVDQSVAQTEPVTPEIDEMDEPVEIETGVAATLRLDTISMQLAEIEEDAYEPAGIFGHATMASMSTGHGNPFAEAFAEEEVVVDRYATADALISQPIVRSIEGKMLSAMLAPYVSQQPQPRFTLTSAPNEMDDDLANADAFEKIRPAEIAASIDNSAPDDDHDPVLPEEPWVYEEPAGVEQPAADSHNSTPIGIDEEEPLIVVEEDPRVSRSVRVQSSTVKRQEYRQLFAKLRRS
jgi:type II secretory pathway predicted ATPase ExeA